MGTKCERLAWLRNGFCEEAYKEILTVTTTTDKYTWIGKDIKRREDPDLLTGRAEFTSDVKLPGMLHPALLRSPYAHAPIVIIATTPANPPPASYPSFTGRDP